MLQLGVCKQVNVRFHLNENWFSVKVAHFVNWFEICFGARTNFMIFPPKPRVWDIIVSASETILDFQIINDTNHTSLMILSKIMSKPYDPST